MSVFTGNLWHKESVDKNMKYREDVRVKHLDMDFDALENKWL